MDRYAIFVDAGYFFAAGAQAAFGSLTPRKQVDLKSPSEMITNLREVSSRITDNLPILRIYWYDAMPGSSLSLQQSTLAMLPGVNLRLGALNSAGEQKGVDSFIVTDIIDLARNRAIADAVVVSGDEDLRIAVQVAQSLGVRVHILGAGDPSKNVSPSLRREADSVATLDAVWFSNYLKLIPPVTKTVIMDSVEAAHFATVVERVINEILESITQEQLTQLNQHFSTQKTVPPEYDRSLLKEISKALGGRLFTGN